MPTLELWKNNAASALAAPIGPGDLTITVASGHGARFPSPTGGDWFWVTLDSGSLIEICKCTARSGDSLTVERGQQGTSASSFVSAAVENRVTKSTLEGFLLSSQASTTPTANLLPIANGSGKLAAGWISEVLALDALSDVTAKTGTGTTVVMSESPTFSGTANFNATYLGASGIGHWTTTWDRMLWQYAAETKNRIGLYSNLSVAGMSIGNSPGLMFAGGDDDYRSVIAHTGNDLAFFTGGTTDANAVQRMRITEAGLVGIGIAAPRSPLHLIGTDLRISTNDTDATGKIGVVVVSNYTNANKPMAVIVGNTGPTYNYLNLGAHGDGQHTSCTTGFFYAAPTSTTTSGIVCVGRWTSTGFGVGDAMPAALFHVTTTPKPYAMLVDATTGYTTLGAAAFRAPLYVVGNAIRVSTTDADAIDKRGVLSVGNYTNSSYPLSVVSGWAGNGWNYVSIGGPGFSAYGDGVHTACTTGFIQASSTGGSATTVVCVGRWNRFGFGVGDADPVSLFHVTHPSAANAFRVDATVGIGMAPDSSVNLAVAASLAIAASSDTSARTTTRVLQRTVGATVGDTTEVGSWNFNNGAGFLEITLTSQTSGYSTAAKYLIPVQYANSELGYPATWLRALPISFTGAYSSNLVEVDTRITDATLDVRLRRVSGAAVATHTLTCTQYGQGMTFTPSTTTATGVSAPTVTSSGTYLTQRAGRVGIGTNAPAYTFDVTGDIRATGSILAHGNTVASAGNLTVTASAGALYLDSTVSNDIIFRPGDAATVAMRVSPQNGGRLKLGPNLVGLYSSGYVLATDDHFMALGVTAFGTTPANNDRLRIVTVGDTSSHRALTVLKTGGHNILTARGDGRVSIGDVDDALDAAHIIGAVRSASYKNDTTNKTGLFVGGHYTNSEEALGLIGGTSTATTGTVFIGGGISTVNAATSIEFYTAVNGTTLTGTRAGYIDAGGWLFWEHPVCTSGAAAAVFFRQRDNQAINWSIYADGGSARIHNGTTNVLDVSYYGDLTSIRDLTMSRKLSGATVLESGYVESNPVNFRFDQDCLRYVTRWGTATITATGGFTNNEVDAMFCGQIGFINLYGKTDPCSIEITGISFSNTDWTAFYPYVFLHSNSNALTVKMEVKKGAGAWEVLYDGATQGTVIDYYIAKVSSTAAALTGVRWTFSAIANPTYLRRLGCIARNGEAYQDTLLKSGGTLYGNVTVATGYALTVPTLTVSTIYPASPVGSERILVGTSGNRPLLTFLNSSGTDEFRIGNPSSATWQIGTLTAIDLSIICGGSERVRLDTNGRVGIGTSAPGSLVHVTASSSASAFRIDGTTGNIGIAQAPGTALVGLTKNSSGYALAIIHANSAAGSGFTLDGDQALILQMRSVTNADVVYLSSAAGTRSRFAQGLVIGATGAGTAGMLVDIDTTTYKHALGLPSVSTTERNALTGVNRMVVYNSTVGKFQGYGSGAWDSFVRETSPTITTPSLVDGSANVQLSIGTGYVSIENEIRFGGLSYSRLSYDVGNGAPYLGYNCKLVGSAIKHDSTGTLAGIRFTGNGDIFLYTNVSAAANTTVTPQVTIDSAGVVGLTALTASKLVATNGSKQLVSYDLVATDIPALTSSNAIQSAKGHRFWMHVAASDLNSALTQLIIPIGGIDSITYPTPLPRACKLVRISITAMHADSTSPPSTWTVDVYKNGSSSSTMSFNLNASAFTDTTTSGNTSSTINFSADDTIGIKLTGTSLDALVARMSLEFETTS